MTLAIGGLALEIHAVGHWPWPTSYLPFLDPSESTCVAGRIALQVEADAALSTAVAPGTSFTTPVWRLYAEPRRFRFESDGHVWAELQLPREAHRASLRYAVPDEAVAAEVNPVLQPVDQLVWVDQLPHVDGLLIHGAGIVVDGAGYLFAGVSGAGKSTFSRLLAASGELLYCGLSDDRVVVRRSGDAWFIAGTPWAGDAGVVSAGQAPLRGIYVLQQADRNRVVPMTVSDAVRRVLPMTSVPWHDATTAERALGVLGDVLRVVPCWRFDFKREPECIAVLREQLHGLPRPAPRRS